MKRSRSSGRMRGAFSLVRILLVAFLVVATWQIGHMATAAIGQVIFGMAILLTAEIAGGFVWVNIALAKDSRRAVPRYRPRAHATAHDRQGIPDLPPALWPSQDKAIRGTVTAIGGTPRWEKPGDHE